MLTQEYLKRVLDYDPLTGIFKYKISRSKLTPVRAVAGYTSKGYIMIRIKFRVYTASHLAWLYMYGELPDCRLDHRDRNRANNRIDNLRKATNAQNIANSGISRNNTSGYKGVSRHYGRWWARIQVNGKRVTLGCYSTAEEAHEVYKRAAIAQLGEFANAARAVK